ncbi:MAG: signal peptidase I [Myxococcota bacterium]|nr:signal peptidase I [Myxococcota bacterium]
MRKNLLYLSIPLLLLTLFLPSRCVVDDDMSKSIQPKDLIWTWNKPPESGDVALLHNPLDPEEVILRRLIATEGQTVRYDRNGTVYIDNQSIRQRDMGNEEPHRIIEENLWRGENKIQWRILRLLKPIQLHFDPVTVPTDHIYVLCDRRDECVDSRLWGAIHKRHIVSFVKVRFGASDPWRSWLDFYP